MAEDPDRGTAVPLDTALDRAHAAMIDAGESEAARRLFFGAVAAAELVLVLEAELPLGSDQIRPMVVEADAGRFVLAFDTDARMAAFVGEAATATLSGRALAAMLAPAGLGVGLNLEVAPSSILLPPEVISWLAENTAPQSEVHEVRIVELAPPEQVDRVLLGLLDARLAQLTGMARDACLAQAVYADGSRGLALAIVGVPEAARTAVTQSFAEAVSLAGLPDRALDVLFLEPEMSIWERVQRVGLRFEVPEPAKPDGPGSAPPGPPILR
ncbi:MAG: SseB family protein [Pseudomonadota bacterium]